MLRMLDLFSGIGGISLGAEMTGEIETVAFCEIESFPQQVLRKHWPHVPIYGDIRDLTKEQLEKDGVVDEIRTIDIISGGFPCQPFSVAGKRRGKNDNRHLWPEMFRLIRELQPRWIVGENVPGIVKLALDDIINELENEGYAARAFIIPAGATGAPHKRERVFIVAHSNGKRWNDRGDHRGERQIHSNKEWVSKKNKQERNGRVRRVGAISETMANTDSARREKLNVATLTKNPGFDTWGADKGGRNRGVKPGLGGMPDGFPAGVDGHRWPAGYGEPQHEWEPPRTTTRVNNRTKRIKALGNAVVPQQIYPIFQAIIEAEVTGGSGG